MASPDTILFRFTTRYAREDFTFFFDLFISSFSLINISVLNRLLKKHYVKKR